MSIRDFFEEPILTLAGIEFDLVEQEELLDWFKAEDFEPDMMSYKELVFYNYSQRDRK